MLAVDSGDGTGGLFHDSCASGTGGTAGGAGGKWSRGSSPATAGAPTIGWLLTSGNCAGRTSFVTFKDWWTGAGWRRRLDSMTFDENASRIQERNAAYNFAWLRRIALSLLKQNESKMSLRGKRNAAALDTDYLEEIVLVTTKVGNS